ncbi:MAG: 50S ribosomal protein L11 methyltransferase [Deltaproteobacteria bacterium]|nr:50S ribosomal protein L11 methyltransferase [Deltaproteobacteria bacterium]
MSDAPAEPRFPYVQVDTTPDRAEEIAGMLFELGASGVETRDDTTTPRGPGGGVVRLVSSFDDEATAAEAASVVRTEFPEVRCEAGEIVGDAWRDAYKQFFAPFALTDSIVVVPPWVEGHGVEAHQRVLWMDPGRAFGTGLHATTRLVSDALERRRESLPDAKVLDVGTGSGILALVALLHGADSAVAIDNDPEVLDVARENAERNGLERRIAVSDTPLESVVGEFPVVVANIRATTLVDMTTALRARVTADGVLILSGILANERDEVSSAFERDGFRVDEVTHRGEGDDAWVAIAVRRTS